MNQSLTLPGSILSSSYPSKESCAMSNGHELDKPMTYVIRVGGELDSKWSDCFRGFAIHSKPDHETLLTGSVDDQGALYGILLKIHNLGLVLLSVERQADEKSCTRNIQFDGS